MNIQELGTIAMYKVGVKIIIFNNGFLGMVRQWQELFYDKRYSNSGWDFNPDFIKVADGYGIPGVKITKKDEIDKSFSEALELPVLEILSRVGYKYNEVVTSHPAVKGSLAMANAGPSTNGSQFFINQVDTHHLNGIHTVFGHLVKGDDILEKIVNDGNGKTQIKHIAIVDKRD